MLFLSFCFHYIDLFNRLFISLYFSISFQYVLLFFWLFECGQSQKKFTQCEEEKKILLAKVNNEASSHLISVLFRFILVIL